MTDSRVDASSDPALNEAAVQSLKNGLRGEVLQPADESYEAARKIFNGMIDKRPALIARCADAEDVIRAVNFSRSENLPVAVRGGATALPESQSVMADS
jgi:FAD/FMN-containing dehydrogenase